MASLSTTLWRSFALNPSEQVKAFGDGAAMPVPREDRKCFKNSSRLSESGSFSSIHFLNGMDPLSGLRTGCNVDRDEEVATMITGLSPPDSSDNVLLNQLAKLNWNYS